MFKLGIFNHLWRSLAVELLVADSTFLALETGILVTSKAIGMRNNNKLV